MQGRGDEGNEPPPGRMQWKVSFRVFVMSSFHQQLLQLSQILK
jgi:hypothetical protein